MKIRKIIYIFLSVLLVQAISSKLYAQKYNEIKYSNTCGESITESKINLEAATYQVSLKVWVDSKAFLKGFKTTIGAVSELLLWELNEVEKNKWVVLTQTIKIDNDVVNEDFKIEMIEDSIFGVGEGNFYLDDITIEKVGYTNNDNFSIEVTNETCPKKGNGQLKISANYPENYIATFNDEEYNFTNEITIENIPSGSYNLCITLKEGDFKQCYNLTIKAGEIISAKASVSSNKVFVNINKGTAPFNVTINGEKVLETSLNDFEINVLPGDLVEVSSAVKCEGVFSKKINLFNEVKVYPNPAKDNITIQSPKQSQISIFNSFGSLVKLTITSEINTVLSVVHLPTGVYVVKIKSGQNVISKIIILD